MISDTPFQALGRRMLSKWKADPAAIALINKLGQCNPIVDDASRMATEAAEQMAISAASKRNQPDWADRCLLMGAMSSFAAALWRFGSDLDHARRHGIPVNVALLVAKHNGPPMFPSIMDMTPPRRKAMERYELEEALERLIAQSGVDMEQVIETLEMMLERYREQESEK